MKPDGTSTWDRAADLRAIEATYARYAQSGRARMWDTHNPGYARLARDLNTRLLSVIRESAMPGFTRILDLGCGTGDLAGEVENLGLRTDWVGVDLRANAIDTARRAYPSARFVTASADAVPEPDQAFDVVVARVLFSSLPSGQLERAVATEISRLLRPGGWLAWVDLRYANPSNPAVHGLGMRTIRDLFPGWEIELETAGLVPPIARRLGRLTGLVYPMLSAFPPLRSHLVGRLRPVSAGG